MAEAGALNEAGGTVRGMGQVEDKVKGQDLSQEPLSLVHRVVSPTGSKVVLCMDF